MQSETNRLLDIPAKAIAEAAGAKWPQDAGRYRQLAGAALRAIRTPTHAMTARVVEPTEDRTKAVAIWHDIIDAVLEDDQ